MRTLAILAFLAVATTGHASGFYLKGTAMFDDPGAVEVSTASAFRTSLKRNVGFSGAMGYKLSLVRAEVEVQHSKNDFGEGSNSTGTAAVSGSLKRFTGFANAFFDLPSFFGLAPYVGGGLGYAKVDLGNLTAIQSGAKTVEFSGNEGAFAYQVAAGLEYHLFGQATIHAGYRIVKHEDIRVKDAVSAAVKEIKLGNNRMFELGVAIGF